MGSCARAWERGYRYYTHEETQHTFFLIKLSYVLQYLYNINDAVVLILLHGIK